MGMFFGKAQKVLWQGCCKRNTEKMGSPKSVKWPREKSTLCRGNGGRETGEQEKNIGHTGRNRKEERN